MSRPRIATGTDEEISLVTKLAAMARVYVEASEGKHPIDEQVAYDMLRQTVDDYKELIGDG